MDRTDRIENTSRIERGKSALWGGPFLFGLVMAALGVFAFLASGIASLASILTLGVLLVAGGITEIVRGFQGRQRGGLILYLLSGVLSLVVGGLFLLRPLAGLAAASLVLAAFFFASGLFRGLTSDVDRYPNWAWDFVYGIVSVVLGIVLLVQWPISAFWAVGVLVGAELLARGIAIMGSALWVRRILKGQVPRPA